MPMGCVLQAAVAVASLLRYTDTHSCKLSDLWYVTLLYAISFLVRVQRRWGAVCRALGC